MIHLWVAKAAVAELRREVVGALECRPELRAVRLCGRP